MDNHSGNSSSADGDLPPSAAATTVSSFGDDSSSPPPVPAPAAGAGRAKLMVSYGGRIQPRPHDNQLSYVWGDTKILAVDRSVRFTAVLDRLTAISGVEGLSVKYQLPGEDLDALISVTDDEDLEHMMLEYDRLQVFNNSASQRSSGCPPLKPTTARLRVFLFPLSLRPPSAELVEPAAPAPPMKPDSQWFVDALNAPARPPSTPLEEVQVKPVLQSHDFLFGFDEGFVPPPAVKVKDLTLEAPLGAIESFPIEIAPPPLKADPLKEDRGSESIAVVSPVEIQRKVQYLQKPQIPENHQQQQKQTQAIHRNGSDEALTRAFPPTSEYYPPGSQEKPLLAPPSTYWTDQRPIATAGARFASIATAGARFASIAGNGDQPVYLITAPAGQAYYAALPRMFPASQLYAVPPALPHPSSAPAPPPKVTGHQFSEGGATGAAAVYAAAQVACNGTGQTMYYASAIPSYQTVGGVGLQNPTDAVKTAAPAVNPSQAS